MTNPKIQMPRRNYVRIIDWTNKELLCCHKDHVAFYAMMQELREEWESGDIMVVWEDEKDQRNVFEHIYF